MVAAPYNSVRNYLSKQHMADTNRISRRRTSLAAALCALAILSPSGAAWGGEAWHRQAQERLSEALSRYEASAASGGWPRVGAGPTLEPGMADPRIRSLRRRLQATGDAAPDASRSSLYDPALETAVRAFQARHGLEVDGLVGRETRAALNVPAQARVATLRLNLERLRAFLPGGPSYVLVNVPAFEARLLRRSEALLETRVIVGRPDWRTPRVEGIISRVVVNPTWTVPRRIMMKETIPRLRRDRDYLARQNMRVFAGWSSGAPELDPASIDWQSPEVRAYRLRQEPGPGNALGRLKFLFDNPYAVYLHDTPAKPLFERHVRAFSHGCIRIAKPVELAVLLLEGQGDWDAAALEAAIAEGETREVWLERPLPIHVVYWTAWGDADGTVQFRPDIYGRDSEDAQAHEPGGCGPTS